MKKAFLRPVAPRNTVRAVPTATREECGDELGGIGAHHGGEIRSVVGVEDARPAHQLQVEPVESRSMVDDVQAGDLSESREEVRCLAGEQHLRLVGSGLRQEGGDQGPCAVGAAGSAETD